MMCILGLEQFPGVYTFLHARKKFPLELAGDYKDDKQALFREWIKMSEQVDVLLNYRRSIKKTEELTTEFCFAKKRDLMQSPWSLPEQKAKSLCEKAKHWQFDPDFPKDEEEKMFWSGMELADVLEESMEKVKEETKEMWHQGNIERSLLSGSTAC